MTFRSSPLAGRFRPQIANAARLKWQCSFESGITLGAWSRVAANNYQRTVTGIQEVESFFGTGAVANIYALPNADVDTEINSVVQATSMTGLRSGAQEMYLTFNNVVDHAANSRPQTAFQIKRAGIATTPDIDECFYRANVRLPSNFETAMNPAKDDFFIIYDKKSGLFAGNPTVGDYRLNISAISFDAGVYTVRSRGDNAANGDPLSGTHIPSVADSNISVGYYWRNDVVVPLVGGRQYQIEVYWKKPQKIWVRNPDPAAILPGMTGAPYLQDTATGITRAWLLDTVTGIRYLLCNQIGGQQTGNENLPDARFLAAILYSGAGDGLPDPGLYSSWSGLEFWDSMPVSLPLV